MAQLIHYFHYKSPYGYLAQEQTYGLRTDIHQSVEWLPDTVDIPCFLARQNRTTQVKIPRAWATITNGDGGITATEQAAASWTKFSNLPRRKGLLVCPPTLSGKDYSGVQSLSPG